MNGVAPEFESNENQQDSTFGVDQHELTEHHLQAALSSHQLEATQGTTSGATKKAYHIPTPKSVEVLSTKQYNDAYPPNAYSDPVTYVRYSDTVEANVRGAPYCLDEDDQGWLDKHNAKARNELDEALKNPKNVPQGAKDQAAAAVQAAATLASQEPEKYLTITEDEFETVMYVFERATCERHPLLELDFAKVPTLDDLLPEFDETSAAAALAEPELPAYNAEATAEADTKPINGKLSLKSNAAKKGENVDKKWSAENPFRHLSLLKPCARLIYPWWHLRRQARDGKPIVPLLNFDESNESDPYVCFRRREVKTARKTRKTDTLQLEKLVRLQSELKQATQLFKMVAQREQIKEQQVKKAHECWSQACRLLDVKQQWTILGPNKGQEDENLIFGVQPDPTAPVPNAAATAQNAQLLKKKRKAEEASSVSTTLKLRRPKPGDDQAHGKTVGVEGSGGIGPAILERVRAIQAYIEREMQWHQQADAGFEDLTDTAYQPPAAPLPQRAFRPIQSDNHDTHFWSNHPVARLGKQPCFRRRVGRGGRVYLDRRPLTVSPAPANIAAWPRNVNGWASAPLSMDTTRAQLAGQYGMAAELNRTQRPLMFSSRLKPTLLPTPDMPMSTQQTRDASMGMPREAFRSMRSHSEPKDGPFATGNHAEVASNSSDSTDHTKSTEDVGDGQSTQATDVEHDAMQEDKDACASDSEDDYESPEEQRERARKLAERWRYDEDGGRWAGLGLLGLGGMEGDEEAVLDDFDHRFIRYRMSLLDETNLLKLSTDWTYMRQALAAAEVHPPTAQANVETEKQQQQQQQPAAPQKGKTEPSKPASTTASATPEPAKQAQRA